MTLTGKAGLDRARTALLTIDVQNCFVSDSPMAGEDGLETVARINEIIRACRHNGILIVHTRSVIRADFADLGPSMSRSAAELCRQGAPTAELHPDLDVGHTDVRVDKSRFDAFYASNLEPVLRGRGIDTIIVSGFHTNLCCDTTTRSAARRDYTVLFAEDATTTREMGGVSEGELRRATCATLGTAFATIVSTTELVEAINRSA